MSQNFMELLEAFKAQFTPVTWRFMVLAALLGALLVKVLLMIEFRGVELVAAFFFIVFMLCLGYSRAMLAVLITVTLGLGGCLFLAMDEHHSACHRLYGSCGPPEFHHPARQIAALMDQYYSEHGTYPLRAEQINEAGMWFPENRSLRDDYDVQGEGEHQQLVDRETGKIVPVDDVQCFIQMKPVPTGLDSLNCNFQYIPEITVNSAGEEVVKRYELVFLAEKFHILGPDLEYEEAYRYSSDNPHHGR